MMNIMIRHRWTSWTLSCGLMEVQAIYSTCATAPPAARQENPRESHPSWQPGDTCNVDTNRNIYIYVYIYTHFVVLWLMCICIYRHLSIYIYDDLDFYRFSMLRKIPGAWISLSLESLAWRAWWSLPRGAWNRPNSPMDSSLIVGCYWWIVGHYWWIKMPCWWMLLVTRCH